MRIVMLEPLGISEEKVMELAKPLNNPGLFCLFLFFFFGFFPYVYVFFGKISG